MDICHTSKILVVNYYLSRLSEAQADEYREELSNNLIFDESFPEGYLAPLPKEVWQQVPRDIDLFPEDFDELFIESLHGHGPKVVASFLGC